MLVYCRNKILMAWLSFSVCSFLFSTTVGSPNVSRPCHYSHSLSVCVCITPGLPSSRESGEFSGVASSAAIDLNGGNVSFQYQIIGRKLVNHFFRQSLFFVVYSLYSSFAEVTVAEYSLLAFLRKERVLETLRESSTEYSPQHPFTEKYSED